MPDPGPRGSARRGDAGPVGGPHPVPVPAAARGPRACHPEDMAGDTMGPGR